MNKVRVVTAFVPLNVKHMAPGDYMTLGEKMTDAAKEAGAEVSWFRDDLTRCWSYELCKDLHPATSTPADRYASGEAHVQSHIVQHTRTQWATEAVDGDDVIVWLDLGILKQGQHTGKLITPDDVKWFIEAVQMYSFTDIPFPGITGPDPWLPHGNNWRFCGSTHIWPVKYLDQIHRSYRANLIKFISEYGEVPLDLAIWPMVERSSGLPFKWYKAEYDNTQLRNFPCAH